MASGATGAWAGWDGAIALHVDGAWMKLAPREGWLLWVEDEDALLAFNGTSWIVPPLSNLGNSKVFVTLPSAQAVPANTWTKIAFSTAFFDAAGTHRFTAPAASSSAAMPSSRIVAASAAAARPCVRSSCSPSAHSGCG